MACIDCGLRVNADGEGTLDIDPDGGIECQGTGGGLTNVVGSGIKIKEDPTAGNSISLSSNGLYVPRKSSFKALQATHVGGAISNPGVGSGGSPVASPVVAVTVDNTAGTSPVTVIYSATLYIASSIDNASVADRWFELAIQNNGGGWDTPVACIIPTNAFLQPWHTGNYVASVGAGASIQLDARAIFYTGDYANGYRVTLTAWGDFSD